MEKQLKIIECCREAYNIGEDFSLMFKAPFGGWEKFTPKNIMSGLDKLEEMIEQDRGWDVCLEEDFK